MRESEHATGLYKSRYCMYSDPNKKSWIVFVSCPSSVVENVATHHFCFAFWSKRFR